GTPGPVCYTPGTLILTMRGEVAVEHLRIGDRLITADHGARKILRVIRTRHSFRDGPHKHKPIEIKSGSLGPGLPRQTLVVSPQHRVLLQGTAVETMFGAREVLALAKGLTGLDHIRAMSGKRDVTYYSLLCERHEVILANGAWSESFYVGPTALSMLHRRSRADLEALFPAVREDPVSGYGPVARPVLTRAETESLVKVLSSSNDSGQGDSRATKWTDETEVYKWDDDLASERSARRAARPKLKLVT
ncbi:MAG: Hint domain-containing protein, partial [Pseudomonadota bacterium]